LRNTFEVNESQINTVLSSVNVCLGSRDTLLKLRNEEQAKIEQLNISLQLYIDTIKLLQLVSSQAQQQISKVEQICTSALQEVFDNSKLSFLIKAEPKRGGIETSFAINDDEVGELDLIWGEAGGTKNIVATCLRLIFTELCSPRVEGPIVLDEVGGNISAEFQENFGKFLRNFSESTRRQIILVSHHRDTVVRQAHNVISITKVGTKSNVQ